MRFTWNFARKIPAPSAVAFATVSLCASAHQLSFFLLKAKRSPGTHTMYVSRGETTNYKVPRYHPLQKIALSSLCVTCTTRTNLLKDLSPMFRTSAPECSLYLLLRTALSVGDAVSLAISANKSLFPRIYPMISYHNTTIFALQESP